MVPALRQLRARTAGMGCGPGGAVCLLQLPMPLCVQCAVICLGRIGRSAGRCKICSLVFVNVCDFFSGFPLARTLVAKMVPAPLQLRTRTAGIGVWVGRSGVFVAVVHACVCTVCSTLFG